MIDPIWPKETLGGLFDIGAGKAMSPSARLGERTYPFLRTANVFWGEVDLSKLDTMNFSEGEIEYKSLKKGDLLVCEGGDIGRSAIWQGQVEKCGFQNHIHRLRPKTPDIVPAFFMYFLQAGFTQLGIYEGAGNKTTIPNLSRGRLAVLEVPKPSKHEQEKITAILWKVQRAIQVEEKLTAIARELKQSAMCQLLTKGLRNENRMETDIGRIPKSWRVCPLSQIAKLERGRFMHRPRNEPRFYGGKTPFVQTGDIVRSQGWIRNHTQTLTDEGVAISRIFPRGTILITIAANIGYTGVLEYDCACPDSLIGITTGSEVDNWYLEYYLQTQQADMDRQAPKGTQKNINIQFLTPWPVIVPSLDEQKEIAAILQTIDRKISVHERKRAALSDLFQTLLHQLMTAQIRVDKLDIDTSEVTA